MVTNKSFYVETGSHSRFMTAIKKQAAYVTRNFGSRWYVQHIILTLDAPAEVVDYRHLNRVLTFIKVRVKRAGASLSYIWVKELQAERLKKYGVKAVHYHILVVFSKPYVIPSSEDIAKSWGLGFVKVRIPRGLVLSKAHAYLGKYLGKGYDWAFLKNKRSFGTSSLSSVYKLSPKRLDRVIERFGKANLGCLSSSYRKVYLIGSEVKSKDTLTLESALGKKLSLPRVLVMDFPSDWSYQGTYNEPF